MQMYDDAIKSVPKDLDKTFKTEKVMQKYCLDYVKKLTKSGVPIMAINQPAGPHNRRGISDVLLCIDGNFVAAELKNGHTNRYDATDLQRRFISEVESAGGHGEVIYSFKEFYDLIIRMLKRT